MKSGQCLCGKISFKADVSDDIQACHCTQCQRWTGGGPLYAVRAKNIQMEGEESVKTYHASEWGERVNCSNCGSILWWKMQNKPAAFVAPGLLDDQSGMKLTEEIFVDYRPDWIAPIPGATQSTEAEQRAQLEAYLAKQKETGA